MLRRKKYAVAYLTQFSDTRVTLVRARARARPVSGGKKKKFIAHLYEHPPLKGQFRISYASQDRLARSPHASPCWLGCNCLGWKCAGNRDRKYIRNLWCRTAAVRRARGEPRLVSKRTLRTPFEARGNVVPSRRIFHNMSRKPYCRSSTSNPSKNGTHASQVLRRGAQNYSAQNYHYFLCIINSFIVIMYCPL